MLLGSQSLLLLVLLYYLEVVLMLIRCSYIGCSKHLAAIFFPRILLLLLLDDLQMLIDRTAIGHSCSGIILLAY